MSQDVTMRFRGIAGTGAAYGTTGHAGIVADRPAGVAGGTGLGFNGAELLAAALGGCFWNDLARVAEGASVTVIAEEIDAEVTVAGSPPRIVRGRIAARITGAPEETLAAVFDQTCAITTIATSIAPAVPIAFERIRP